MFGGPALKVAVLPMSVASPCLAMKWPAREDRMREAYWAYCASRSGLGSSRESWSRPSAAMAAAEVSVAASGMSGALKSQYGTQSLGIRLVK